MQKNISEDFIEDYSEQFASIVSEEFFSAKTHISGQEILTITPSKQVNFFVIKLLFNNWQDESQRLESPFFDYTANDVKEAMLQFMNVLSRHIKVARKEFEILLQDAVRDTLFFIMSPNVYMEIEMDRKGTETLTEKSAKNLIKYIRICKEEFAKSIMASVGTDRDDISLDESIITDEILQREISFLNEVLPLTLKQLEEGDDDDNTETSNEEDNLLKVEEEDLFGHGSKTAADEEEKEEEVEAQDAESDKSDDVEDAFVNDAEEEDSMEDDEDIEDEDDEGRDDYDNVKDRDEEDEEEEEDEIEKPAPSVRPVKEKIITNLDPDDEDEDDEDSILNKRFEDPMVGTIAEAHEKSADGMLQSISLNHRYMFINELFDGEAELFAQAIEKVEKSTSFDDSVEILVQNYAKEFHWDMNSDEVKELLKIIFRRFR